MMALFFSVKVKSYCHAVNQHEGTKTLTGIIILRAWGRHLGCVSLRKSEIGLLNPKESENEFCVS